MKQNTCISFNTHFLMSDEARDIDFAEKMFGIVWTPSALTRLHGLGRSVSLLPGLFEGTEQNTFCFEHGL